MMNRENYTERFNTVGGGREVMLFRVFVEIQWAICVDLEMWPHYITCPQI